MFNVTPLSAGKKCILCFDCGGKILSAEIKTVYKNSQKIEELITGPGVETTYWHQLLRGTEDFFALETGNCLRISIDDFLNNLHHIPTPDWVPLIKYLVRRQKYFALQRIRVPHYSKIQHKDLKKLADIGGKLFAGVSIAEPVLFFAHDPAGKQTDLSMRIKAYRRYFRKRLEEVKLKGHKVVTFDSSGGMCGHYYQLGLDVQISEVAPACNILEEACSRGAATAFGKQWGVAAAMHWYAGQGAQYAYDEARVCYAWLVMMHSYLAGARQILWEGGMFDNLPVYNFILSEESWRDFGRRYDHPLLIKAREGFNRLLNFHRAQQLHSPKVEFAVIRGINDMPISYSDSTSRYGDMSMARSWALLKVFLPHFCQGGRLESGRNIRRWYSATPYGQVDVVPAEADENAFKKYKMLSLLGWNTMTDELYSKLIEYVRSGGVLFISTAHFTTDTFQKLEWNFINKGDLSELCGVEILDLGGRVETVEFKADDFKERFDEKFVLSKKNPLFVEHFDELYPVFGNDVTYFCGELKVKDAEIVAVSQKNEPVVLRHKLGKGFVYLFNSYCHPGRGNFQKLAELVMRIIVEKFPSNVQIEDKEQLVSWFEYTGKQFNRYFFINTNWAQPDEIYKTQVSIKGVKFDLSLKPAVPLQIVEDGNTFMVIKDPFTQVAEWEKVKNGRKISLIGDKNSFQIRNRKNTKIIMI